MECNVSVYVFLYFTPPRFSYQTTFVSFGSSTTGVTNRAGTVNPSRTPAVFSGVRVA
jgi:hypothetical protein